eukprot:TRINITY_DN16488_c0_g1_i1.p1 TRINITY_DN16488_c0_g1~~TRINITY_DN16488_c0_g1_i1.p1  ORF type:complete len:133 (+),score=24.78 TRINITY_DN16488_c0_g1_i1:261-659(+)
MVDMMDEEDFDTTDDSASPYDSEPDSYIGGWPLNASTADKGDESLLSTTIDGEGLGVVREFIWTFERLILFGSQTTNSNNNTRSRTAAAHPNPGAVTEASVNAFGQPSPSPSSPLTASSSPRGQSWQQQWHW